MLIAAIVLICCIPVLGTAAILRGRRLERAQARRIETYYKSPDSNLIILGD